MKTLLMTDYFRNEVLVKRAYLRMEWCAEAIAQPLRSEVQHEDGRIRHWIFVQELGYQLRVVTLEYGMNNS